jgi:hypothetical protein
MTMTWACIPVRCTCLHRMAFRGVEQQKLLAPGGKQGDLFGYWAAISGDTMIVSAALYDDGVNNSDFGAAFTYIKGVSTWNLQQKLSAPDRKPGDWLARTWPSKAIRFSSALSKRTNSESILDPHIGSFAITPYGVYATNCSQYLVRQARGLAGPWVYRGNLAAVGAPFNDTKATDAGAVYIFSECKTNGRNVRCRYRMLWRFLCRRRLLQYCMWWWVHGRLPSL